MRQSFKVAGRFNKRGSVLLVLASDRKRLNKIVSINTLWDD